MSNLDWVSAAIGGAVVWFAGPKIQNVSDGLESLKSLPQQLAKAGEAEKAAAEAKAKADAKKAFRDWIATQPKTITYQEILAKRMELGLED